MRVYAKIFMAVMGELDPFVTAFKKNIFGIIIVFHMLPCPFL